VIARWGGEEYLFLLPDTSGSQALNSAEKWCIKIANTQYKYGDDVFNINVSMGSHQNTSIDTINHAISKADSNLYKAKAHGRNRSILD
jgi:diguanylate cyclase (GGDEF)-like protein